jgi:hypothetical protein
MPMSQLERDTLAKNFALCKNILADLQPRLAGLNEVYNAAGGVKETLDQTELDELPELSGLQKTTVDDAVFALSNVLTAIDAAYPALAQCAARFI